MAVKSSLSSSPASQTGASHPPNAPVLPKPCRILSENADGLTVSVHIEPEILRRIRTRSQSQPIDDYVWANIIRPALNSHVY